MTSMGEMSAARMTMKCGGSVVEEEVEVEGGDLRMALTTSLTPRLSVLALLAFVFEEGGRC